MAGHSKFKNIMHKKGRQDAARSKLFSKLSRDITVAAKSGLPDPNMNPRLRLAVANAKAESMPKDNIERAIAKGTGEGAEAESLEARLESRLDALDARLARIEEQLHAVEHTCGGHGCQHDHTR